MPTCVFCNIALRAIPAEIVFENGHVVAIKDIHPVAPVHALVIPKRHIVGIHELGVHDVELVGQVVLAAREVAEHLGLAEGGYRLVINQGSDAGQSVLHLHCHVIGGRAMAWPPG